MKKGRMPMPQRFRHVYEIRDVDVFGDGNLWTVAVLEGGMRSGRDGRLELAPGAKVITINPQSVEPFNTVYIPESVLKRVRARFALKKGVSE